ncbi:paraslipin [Lactobacillus sp. S2-2]|uniref:SPFH domain-containing protein n=1 Tax=Lactobacillus sp. S2-2 TaxID=2692917 RepID=UPI001F3101B6|nr:SPFH domain-containing protein [Lactobacillus sp. S2-2]MCF6515234.1 paraslipin [Lactobacillus sp. S2-2]
MLGIRIIKQNHQGLVETLGKYKKTISPGLHFYIPLVQRIHAVNLAMVPLELPGYPIITQDNAEVSAKLTLNYHVTDAVKFQYENSDSVTSMCQLVRGDLRNIVGKKQLNDTLGATSAINKELTSSIGDLTNTYGINVDRVNIDELNPTKEIQKSMDKQLRADREKTAAIAEAEGQAESINIKVKAENNAKISTAQAEGEATKTRADAESYRIKAIQTALATADNNYFLNQKIDAFNNLANSDTNLVVTSNDTINDATTNGALFAKGFEKQNNKKEDSNNNEDEKEANN